MQKRNTRPFPALPALILPLVCLLAGCGSDSSTEGATDASSSDAGSVDTGTAETGGIGITGGGSTGATDAGGGDTDSSSGTSDGTTDMGTTEGGGLTGGSTTGGTTAGTTGGSETNGTDAGGTDSGTNGSDGSTHSVVSLRADGTLVSAQPPYWDDAIDFTTNLDFVANLEGNLPGRVSFLQNTLVAPKRSANANSPMLTSNRTALLLFMPVGNADSNVEGYSVQLTAATGQILQRELLAPQNGPLSDFNPALGRQALVYSKDAWNMVVPWDFMHAGMSLSVTARSGARGILAAEQFEFGPPIELVTQHIELGMLIDPQSANDNQWTPQRDNISAELAIDYFQTVPIAKFTAAQYLPAYFPTVVLPNGTVYTQRSSYENAGVYSGDMRENIAKGMVSTGINLAGIGVSSSAGGTQSQPRPYRQTTVHTSIGVYTQLDNNGVAQDHIVKHGLSGGGGQLTLLSTTGNEFSHEYGHDHGLGHYPGGDLSTHSRDGSWGYHSFKHRLVANLRWTRPADDEIPYVYNRDAMAGGTADSSINAFTLHTPYSLKLIQENLAAASGVLDANSNSGYSHWNQQSQSMQTLPVDTPKPTQTGIPVMTLVGFYDPNPAHTLASFIYPALYGNWGNTFDVASMLDKDPALGSSLCELQVTSSNGSQQVIPLADSRFDNTKMNQFHVNFDSTIEYNQANVSCSTSGTSVVLDTRNLSAPTSELSAPVIVGAAHGYAGAATQARKFSSRLGAGNFHSTADLETAIRDAYGPVFPYRTDRPVIAGYIYSVDRDYYVATTDQPARAPGQDPTHWRMLGNASDYVSDTTLGLGVASVDYAQDTMNGTSGVYYYVPIDGTSVRQSDSSSPSSRQWYATGNHSKIRVAATAQGADRVDIILRGQINDNHVLNRGAPINENSRVRFSFVAQDNPTLAAGNYDVSFAAVAMGWHSGEIVEAFTVIGTVIAP